MLHIRSLKIKKFRLLLIFIFIFSSFFFNCQRDRNTEKEKEDEPQIELFLKPKLTLNKKILVFVSEFINYTEDKFGKDHNYILYFENLMGDKHLITIYLLPKNEEIYMENYIGLMNFQNRKIFISICLRSILGDYNQELEKWKDYTLFQWQLILNRDNAEIHKTFLFNNDSIIDNHILRTNIEEMVPYMLEKQTKSKVF